MNGVEENMDVRFEEAEAADLPQLRALLAQANLPEADVGASNQVFLVARAPGGALVGCVALERYGDDVLLRSLAVVPSRRGEGLGVALHARALERARKLGARTVYLLTTTAEGLFARAGYARIERSAVPAEVRASPEFDALCPASAVCMIRRLG
ncbi:MULTISPECIES: arsenic resistance N-acetyltransferase ArsN2 [Anaeromyxobacter]|uniref:arsenic resistance N-acetyltransferase ArsN2 n=1 Tax=Anaeromyxobacter TaxID=161492 RepID=UPI001F5775DB|nr:MULTISPECIES: arsenic resistance N-acetyltransferase ArsN2 [unclassified Anaeromyxobacter]